MGVILDIAVLFAGLLLFMLFWVGASENPVTTKYSNLPQSSWVKRFVDFFLLVSWVLAFYVATQFVWGEYFNGYSPGYSKIAVCLFVGFLIGLAKNKLRATLTAFVLIVSYGWMLSLGDRYFIPFYKIGTVCVVIFLFYLIGFSHGKEEETPNGESNTSVRRKSI